MPTPSSLHRTPRPRALLCAAALALATPALSPERAQALELRVGGASKLYAQAQGAGTAAQITGALRDELGKPLPQRVVRAEITPAAGGAPRRVELVTDMQGRFSFQEEFAPGEYSVSVRFDETEHLAGASALFQVTLRRSPPRLAALAPELITGDRPAFVRLRASVDELGIQSPVRLSVNGKPATTAELDPYGRGAVDVSRWLVEGVNVIDAALPATPLRAGATARVTLRYSAAPRLSATLEYGHMRLDRGLVVRGQVKDDHGPLQGGAVFVTYAPASGAPNHAEGAPPATTAQAPGLQDAPLTVTTKTDADGAFTAFLPSGRLHDGVWMARVVFRPEIGPELSAETATITVDRTSSRVALNVLGLLAILVGVGVLFQRLSVVDLREWFARLRGEPRWDRQGAEADAIALTFGQEEALVVEQIAGPAEAVSHDRLGGVVWDTWRRQPVPHATITLTPDGDDAPITIEAGPHGGFITPALSPGQWHVIVRAPGYSPGTMTATLPHDGRLGRVRVGLIAIPYKIRRAYQQWVKRARGDDAWGELSPRQIEAAVWGAFETLGHDGAPQSGDALRHRLGALLASPEALQSAAADQVMEMVTEVVEQSIWSGDTQDEATWSLMVELLDRLDALRSGDAKEQA